MSIRSTILKAIGEAEGGGLRAASGVKKKAKARKMPPQGKTYDVTRIQRQGLWWEDTSGNGYKRYSVNGKSYMRRNDGVWYKPMRTGEWTSMLTAPKGGEALHFKWQAAKGLGAAAAGGIAANEARRRM